MDSKRGTRRNGRHQHQGGAPRQRRPRRARTLSWSRRGCSSRRTTSSATITSPRSTVNRSGTRSPIPTHGSAAWRRRLERARPRRPLRRRRARVPPAPPARAAAPTSIGTSSEGGRSDPAHGRGDRNREGLSRDRARPDPQDREDRGEALQRSRHARGRRHRARERLRRRRFGSRRSWRSRNRRWICRCTKRTCRSPSERAYASRSWSTPSSRRRRRRPPPASDTKRWRSTTRAVARCATLTATA